MPTTIQRSFTSGEIAPALRSRADLIKYATGLALCENFLIRAQGGAYSRPGYRFVGELDDMLKRGRLIPFSFNVEQTYILVFEDLKMRVIKDGAYVLKPVATITGITQANPAVVTTSAPHTFANGEKTAITGVVGMTEVNGTTPTIANVTASTFELQGVDSTSFGAYVSGGSAQSNGIFELVTPYTEAQLSRLIFTQSADVMTITHPSHDPRNLSRTADDAWSLDVINYASTVTAPGTLTLTAVGDVLGGGDFDKTYTYVVTTIDANGIESLPSPSNSITQKSLSVTFGVKIDWTDVAGADKYRIYKDPSNGTGVFGFIGESKNSVFEDFNIAPLTSDAPPEDRQPFAGVDNKPATVTFYQQRQVFANTNNEPQTIFTTQTNNFNSLRTSSPARDDDAVTLTIAAREVNEIRHLVSLNTLLALTSGGEWLVSEGQDQVLTPSTVGVRAQSFNGVSFVPPVIVNSTALYIQEKGAKVRDLGYEFTSDKYTGTDLSLMSEHLFDGFEIEEMTYASEPYSIVWMVRNDGTLLGLTFQREHQVVGWHQHMTDGTFESVASISEDDRDAVYVIVKRTINGVTKRYVERLEKREEKDARDAFYVDSGLTLDTPSTISGATRAKPVVITDVAHGYSNADLVDISDVVGMIEINDRQFKIANTTANTYELTDQFDDTTIDGTGFTDYVSGGESRKAVTAISGLTHLEGEAVAVLANGNEVEDLTVTSGAITLPRAASRVHVGLAYTPALETLDIDIASGTDSLKGNSVTVSKVIMEVFKSRGGFIGPKKDDDTSGTLFEIKPRFDSDGYDSIALRTFKEEILIEPQWSKGGGIRIEQRSPLPLAILSIIPRVDAGGT